MKSKPCARNWARERVRLYLTELARRQDIWLSRALIQRLQREVLGE